VKNRPAVCSRCRRDYGQADNVGSCPVLWLVFSIRANRAPRAEPDGFEARPVCRRKGIGGRRAPRSTGRKPTYRWRRPHRRSRCGRAQGGRHGPAASGAENRKPFKGTCCRFAAAPELLHASMRGVPCDAGRPAGVVHRSRVARSANLFFSQ